MEVVLHIESTFESTYLINGRFFEKATIKAESNEIVYITVLPLDPSLIPYTIKLLGHRPLNGGGLCLSYKLSGGRYYIRMLERYNYVYTTKKQQPPVASDNVFKLFKLIKQKSYADARLLMSDDLSSSIDNNSLDSFFEPFIDIVENKGYITAPFGSYFLIDKTNTATVFVFETKGGVIENIYEFAVNNSV